MSEHSSILPTAEPNFSFEALTDDTHALISHAATLTYRRFFQPHDERSGKEYGTASHACHQSHGEETRKAIQHFAVYEENTKCLLTHSLALTPKNIIEYGFAYGALMAEAKTGFSYADKENHLEAGQQKGEMLQAFISQALIFATGLTGDSRETRENLKIMADYAIEQGHHYSTWRNSSPV